MDARVPPDISEKSPGVAVSARPLPAFLWALVRNPLNGLPPEIFREGIVYARIFGEPRILLADPVLIHEALVRNADALVKGDDTIRTLGPALGEGLLTADGAHWRWQRQSVAPAFRHENLLGMLPAMIAAAERTRDRWLTNGASPTIKLGHEMMRTTFDIIVETMMSGRGGIDVARVEQGITDYLGPSGWMIAFSILKAPNWVPYPGRRRARQAAAYLRSAVLGMIAERRRRADQRDDMVGLLLAAFDPETGRTMTDGEIADNLLTFVTAGHETTALGLAWTFHLLAQHPEIAAKALAEIEAVTRGDAVRPEHVAELVYTRQVFSEAMRLYPPAPIITRRAVRDFQLGEFTIPRGSAIVVPIYAVHHHSQIWHEPERFDPDRFAPDQAKARHRYAYMPFGAGPRTCIGSAFAIMEAVAILAVLLKAVRLENPSEAVPVPTMKVTLRPMRELNMRVIPRAAGR